MHLRRGRSGCGGGGFSRSGFNWRLHWIHLTLSLLLCVCANGARESRRGGSVLLCSASSAGGPGPRLRRALEGRGRRGEWAAGGEAKGAQHRSRADSAAGDLAAALILNRNKRVVHRAGLNLRTLCTILDKQDLPLSPPHIHLVECAQAKNGADRIACNPLRTAFCRLIRARPPVCNSATQPCAALHSLCCCVRSAISLGSLGLVSFCAA